MIGSAPILRSQVSAIGYQVQVFGCRSRVRRPYLNTRTRNLRPETRDQKMSSLPSPPIKSRRVRRRISSIKLAGKDGVEPSPADLETAVLP